MDITNLKLTIFNCFLGAIGRGVRAIAYDYTNDTIGIYVYFDREPDEDDYDVIDIAVTEIMASYPNFVYQDIIMIKSMEPIGKLDSHKGWIFIRYEN